MKTNNTKSKKKILNAEKIRLEFEAEILPQLKIFNDAVFEADKQIKTIRKNKDDYQSTIDDSTRKIESFKKQIANAVIDGKDETDIKDLEEVLHSLQADAAASLEVVRQINAKLTKIEEQHGAARRALATEAGKIQLRLCKTAIKHKARIGKIFNQLLILVSSYEQALNNFADRQQYISADFSIRTFLVDSLHSVDLELLYNSKRLTSNLGEACAIAEKKIRAKQSVQQGPAQTPQQEEEAAGDTQLIKELKEGYRFTVPGKRKFLIRSRQEAKNYIASIKGDNWKKLLPEAAQIIKDTVWPDDVKDSSNVKSLILPALKEYAKRLDIKIQGMSRQEIEDEIEGIRAAEKQAAKLRTKDGVDSDFQWDIDHTKLPPSFLRTYTKNLIKYAKLIGVNPHGLKAEEIKDRIREHIKGPKAVSAVLLKDVYIDHSIEGNLDENVVTQGVGKPSRKKQ